MKIFVGWSHSSERYAQALRTFLLNCFDEHIDVFISGDIPIGARWREELNGALKEADYGVFCLTYDSVPEWICYEAGMLSARGIPVAPLLFEEADSSMLFSPLADGQAKQYSNEAVSAMAQAIFDAGAKKDVEWGTFTKARANALKLLEQEAAQITEEIRSNRRYTINSFSSDLECLKGSGESGYQAGYREWLFKLGKSLISILTSSEKFPVKLKWERIEDFKKQLNEHGGNDPMCLRICQKVDYLIDG